MATLYEKYNTGASGSGVLSVANNWESQTFTPSVAHTITSVKILLYRLNSPGTVTVSIKATDGVGKPTEEDIVSGTTDGDTLPTTYQTAEWREITFGAGTPLTAGIKYAIVVRAVAVSGTLYWRGDATSPTYAGGSRVYSSNSGSSWTVDTSWDYMFEDWGATIVRSVKMGANGAFIVVTAKDGVYLSTDSGANWSRKTPDAVETTDWTKGICSSDGTYIIVVSSADAIYRSANSGTAWAEITPAGGDTFSVNKMATSDDGQFMVIVGQNSTDATESCYISTDYGATWTAKKPIAASIEWTDCDISNDGAVIAVSTSSYFYVSFDSGATWMEQGMASSAEVWEGLSISGDGTIGLVANTNDNDEFFIGAKTELYSEATWAEAVLTSAGRALLDDADAPAQATTLGLGTGDSPQFTGLTLSAIAAEATDVDKFLVDSTGVIKYRTGAEVLADIGASASTHLHDTQTLQHDAVNSDGGAFSFTTTGLVTFNQNIAMAKVCELAAGLNVLRVTGLQTDGTAMTGTLRGAYIDVSNGNTAATGTIRGMELKARTEAPGDVGNDVAVLEGLSISADSKDHSVTTMRAAEFILDGSTGGTITEAVGLRIANNLQANKATTSYGLQIYRDSFDYTADIQLSDGSVINKSGRWGIGTATPNADLDIGNASNSATRIYIVSADDSAAGINMYSGYVGEDPSHYGQIKYDQEHDLVLTNVYDDDDADIIFKVKDTTEVLRLKGSGGAILANILELEDTTTSTTGVIYKGADRFIHNFHSTGNGAVPDGLNTFIGIDAGNFTMGDTAWGTWHASGNVGIGYQALKANTLGYTNLALGSQALTSNTTGYNNTAIGKGALALNTTGYANLALGTSALAQNITGYNNLILGGGAGYAVTGSSNVFIGYAAGFRQIATSNLLIIDNQERDDAAEEATNAIIYGVMADAVADQTLTLNALVNASQGIRTKRSVADTTNPPTDAELDTAFGTPSAVGEGFIGILDDNDAGANIYICVSTGTDADKWWYVTLTQAA